VLLEQESWRSWLVKSVALKQMLTMRTIQSLWRCDGYVANITWRDIANSLVFEGAWGLVGFSGQICSREECPDPQHGASAPGIEETLGPRREPATENIREITSGNGG